MGDASNDQAGSAPAGASPGGEAAPGRPRVLLAGQGLLAREATTRLLGERWTLVQVGGDGPALAEAEERPPDLVVGEVAFPGPEPFGLLEALRARPALRRVPVILVAARASEEERLEALHRGADDVLVEPFSPRELVARVAVHLDMARVRAEAERDRARLHALLEQAPVPVSVLRAADLVFELANPAYEELVGRTGLAGRAFREVFPELAQDDPVLAMLEDVRRTGRPLTVDEYHARVCRDASGASQDVTYKLSCQPIARAGEVVSVMTVALDVTEQFDARRETETVHRVGRALAAELDLDRIFQLLTDEATRLCRGQIGVLLLRDGTRIRSSGATGDLEDLATPAPGADPPGSRFQIPVQDRDGAEIGRLVFAHARAGVFGAREERLVATITAQATSAIENARLYQQARAAESRVARLQAITAVLARALTPTEAMRALLSATLPFLEAAAGTGYLLSEDGERLEARATQGATVPRLVFEVTHVPLTARLPVCEAARSGRVVWHASVEEIRAHNPELESMREAVGARAWGAVPLVFEGRPVGALAYHATAERDLSPAEKDFLLAAGLQCAHAVVRAQLFEQARAARNEAEAASRAKDEFLAMLGHELRNPLAPIQTALQLMRLRGDESLSRERTVIERQVNHVVRLVDDLLDVSRITRGNIELKRGPIELAEVIAKAIEIASPLIEEQHHQLEVEIPRHGVQLYADAVRLAQVFANLLTNAAKYTPPRGAIAVRASVEGSEVLVRVRDNGLGIAPEILPRIFETFVQERQSLERTQGGLGLGLTIVRSMVQLHGGEVEAFSEGRGRGSEFVVRLPLTTPPEAGSGPHDTSAPRAAGEGAALRVLVVDDNVDAADLLAESLRAMGHATAVAYDGVTALQLASGFAPQAALLDIGLPVMDGYELGAQLKDLDPELKVFAITGYGQDSDRQRSQEAGFDGHLVKPIHLEEVSALLERLVHR